MSDYFSRFMKLASVNVDSDAASRWSHDARIYGDRNIKAQMATARRAATVLEKSVDQFSNLRPEQELAIKAGASAMRSLANDMQGVSVWAKRYKEFCDAEYKRERTAELEALASERWADDPEAFAFECCLICELATTEGARALGQWMHGRGECTHISVDHFLSPFASAWITSFQRASRREAAECIHGAMKNRERHMGWDQKHVHLSWTDYESYFAYRKAATGTTARVVQMVSSQ